MALDGLVVASIVRELSPLLQGAKIDKVYQPEPDELTLLIRGQGKNLRLLLSSSSQYPRVHFTQHIKDNPAVPPNFCMLLRKHLQGGRILSIHQPDLERIIEIVIESYDELKVLKKKRLIIEIMGKHSNIILVDGESGKIVDAIRRISIDMSRYRQVLPGLLYATPPSQDKENPLLVTEVEAFQQVLSQKGRNPVFQAIYTSYQGISPLLAREICFLADVPEDTPVLSLQAGDIQRLFHHFQQVFQRVQSGPLGPRLYRDPEKDKTVDYYSIPLAHLSYYQEIPFDTVSELLDVYYHQSDSRERMKQKTQNLRKHIATKLERLIHKVENLKQDLQKTEKAEELRIYGELLTGNLHLLQGKEDQVSVINYYDPELKEIVIPLDRRLTPAQNAQRYYKQYNKLKTAVKEVAHQIEVAQEEIQYLDQVLMNIDQATQLSDIEEIQSELMETGYLKRKQSRKPSSMKKTGYLRFVTSDGYEVLVGKNNKQNDEITFKVSGKNDLWLHVKDIPGSHTILKTQGEGYSDQALLEAAHLAAYYSKGRDSTKIAVDYTLRKNVKKPAGAKPGMVIYETYQTIYVDGNLSDFPHLKASALEG